MLTLEQAGDQTSQTVLEELAEEWFALTCKGFDLLSLSDPESLLRGAQVLMEHCPRVSLTRYYGAQARHDVRRAVACGDVQELLYLGRELLPAGAWVRKALRLSRDVRARRLRKEFDALFEKYAFSFRKLAMGAMNSFLSHTGLAFPAYTDDVESMSVFILFRALDTWRPECDTRFGYFAYKAAGQNLARTWTYLPFVGRSPDRFKDFVYLSSQVPREDNEDSELTLADRICDPHAEMDLSLLESVLDVVKVIRLADENGLLDSLDRAVLRVLLYDVPYDAIVERFGVTTRTVRSRMKRLNKIFNLLREGQVDVCIAKFRRKRFKGEARRNSHS